jgi:hypothetical protein
MLAAAGVYLALPEPLSVGPSWLLLAIIVLLMIPIVVSDRRGNHNVTRTLTFIANGIITIAMVAALIHLIEGIPHHLETPNALLRSAAALWIANILVFALWYWKLDAGGPLRRDRGQGMSQSSFLFPQMLNREGHDASWTPHFVDVQHEHGVFANGYGGVVAVGEAWHDAAVADFADDCGAACGAGSEYFVSCDSARRYFSFPGLA